MPRCATPGAIAILLLAPAARAQLEILQPPPSLPSLPEPPTLQHLLLESPIPVAIAAIALVLGAYAVINRLGRPGLARLAAATLALVAGGLVALSLAVKTTRERVIDQTRALVAAVADARIDDLDTSLDDEVRLFVRGSGSGWTKPRILGWVDQFLAPGHSYAVEKHHVSEIQAEIGPSGQTARARADVSITPAGDALPTRFVCMLTWRKDAAGEWKLVQIDPLWLQGWGVITDGDMARAPG